MVRTVRAPPGAGPHAAPRGHVAAPARPGAAGRAPADRRAAAPRRDPRQRRLRVSRGLRRWMLRHGRPARRRKPVGADPRAQGADEDAARRWRSADASSSARVRSAASSRAVRRVRGRERHRRLPPARPAQRRLEPARGGEAISPPTASSTPASSTAPARRRDDALVEQAQKLPELGAARILLHDPSGSLSRTARASSSRARRGERPARRHLLPGSRR